MLKEKIIIETNLENMQLNQCKIVRKTKNKTVTPSLVVC